MPPGPPATVFILIDWSGSYDYLKTAVERVVELLKTLPPGTRVVVRKITGDSYPPENSIKTTVLPNPREIQNPLNPNERRRFQAEKKRYVTDRNELISTLVNAPSTRRSSRTDILGGLLYCAENLNMAKGSVHLLIASDLKNNVSKYGSYLKRGCLSNVKVYVISYQNVEPDLRTFWDMRFRDLGAISVNFWGPDDRFTANCLVK